jgi:hypothetical protein
MTWYFIYHSPRNDDKYVNIPLTARLPPSRPRPCSLLPHVAPPSSFPTRQPARRCSAPLLLPFLQRRCPTPLLRRPLLHAAPSPLVDGSLAFQDPVAGRLPISSGGGAALPGAAAVARPSSDGSRRRHLFFFHFFPFSFSLC